MENKFYTFTEYINTSLITPSEEDYLEMIYRLQLSSQKVTNDLLARNLNIKPASVTKMITKLQHKELIINKKKDKIVFTDIGLKIAIKLYQRHDTLYTFFLNIGIDNPLQYTEKLEHGVDDLLINKLIKLNEIIKNNPDLFKKI